MSAASRGSRPDFELGGKKIAAGSSGTVEIPVANLYTHTPVHLPVRVLHGKRDGPVLWVSAALHGDEINGVEIVRRVLRHTSMKRLSGTLIAVPIVNTLAFLHQSRYLPDRRDLNRSFPGSERGSLAARLAHKFLQEVVGRSDYGIDLHTGAVHRGNLPQIRANLENPVTTRLAKAFGAPLLLNSPPTDGTLRAYTTSHGIPVLLYEASEALRFDEVCIRIGVRGVIRVMRELQMLPEARAGKATPEPVIARSSSWVRAGASGILRAQVNLGDRVRKDQPLGVIGDPFGEHESIVTATESGVVIGRLNLPLVHEGDALFHVARVEKPGVAAQTVETVQTQTADWNPPDNEPPIV